MGSIDEERKAFLEEVARLAKEMTDDEQSARERRIVFHTAMTVPERPTLRQPTKGRIA